MAKIAVENGRISNFKGLVTLTMDRVILHTIVHHSLTITYMPNFIEIEVTFCGRTNEHTYTQVGRRPRPALLGRLWRDDLIMVCTETWATSKCYNGIHYMRNITSLLTLWRRVANWLTDWLKVLCPTRHKIGHFKDVLPSQLLGLVQKKPKHEQKQTCIHNKIYCNINIDQSGSKRVRKWISKKKA